MVSSKKWPIKVARYEFKRGHLYQQFPQFHRLLIEVATYALRRQTKETNPLQPPDKDLYNWLTHQMHNPIIHSWVMVQFTVGPYIYSTEFNTWRAAACSAGTHDFLNWPPEIELHAVMKCVLYVPRYISIMQEDRLLSIGPI
jgi:hypothetical protein